MQVKVFSVGFSDSPDVLEEEINEWFFQNRHVHVLSESITSTSGINSEGNVFINVTYIIRFC